MAEIYDIYFNQNKQAFAHEIENPVCTIKSDLWEQYAGTDKWDIINGVFTDISDTEEYKQKKAQEERAKKDNMTLTPADVWRALYKAKQMRSSDLLTLIEEQMTGVDMNLVEIEFGANLFYRGATLGNGRLFDSIGALLGYSSDDMDYLFEHKELPVVNNIDYSSMTVAQLKALADERGITYPSNILKADLIALLEA